jgi:hypothetical protein
MRINYRVSVLLISILSFAAPLSCTTISEASQVATNPYGASTIDPAGPNEVILTVSSKSLTKTYKYADLVKLAKQDLIIHEPFLKKVQKFRVIPLATLFAASKISASSQVVTQALNDYIYTNKASTFVKAKGYLAIQRTDKEIPYDQGGPIRIIYPDNSTWAKFLDPWNWSISSIYVK